MSITVDNTHGSTANYGTIAGPVENTNHFYYGSSEDLKLMCLRALLASLGQGREPTQARRFLRTCKGETTEGNLEWFLKAERYTECLNSGSNLL
jgi:hypothetical protein